VITNIDQLQGADNRWLTNLPNDFFDLILFDEGHHAVAQSWATLRQAFPNARIVNFSATPRRADGQIMPGRVIYSFSVRDAISQGYVKRLRGLVLNPASLRYVRNEDGQEVEVTLDEVCRLGEEDAQFRRSIVSSEETLSTIVDASIRELDRIRQETGDQRHKIIASALNFQHCHQIVAAFQARGWRAAFVHSRQDSAANDRILNQLENHELDVIVQVRKLGEGFDHPYLSVAAVCSIFAELSPFVQFVGRIMRVVDHDNPESPNNQGTVVFHAGSNVASRWNDFRDFSEADQEFFDQLLPIEALDFTNREEIEVSPRVPRPRLQVRDQTNVVVQEIPLLHDEEASEALRLLQERGYSAEQITEAFEHLPVPTTRVRQRQASRQQLNNSVQNLTGTLLRENTVNFEGHDLDRRRLNLTNFQVIIVRINALINERIEDKPRNDYSQDELDAAEAELPSIRQQIIEEFFNA
ncbi:MAG: DEAD/DEAH box helicase family protein, partial [Thermoleophilia bacterium]|jgi:superfamily II DNA or RNA helicase